MATRQVAVLSGPGRLEVREEAAPRPGPGEVLVDVEGCGLCGSNLPVWEGRPWFTYPLAGGAPGHESWGYVREVGPPGPGGAAPPPAPGTRVAVLHEQALATQLCVPSDAVVALPSALDGRPFPGEALACAWNVARRSGFAAGQTVAVVGLGFLGTLVAGLAHAAGAQVVGVSRRACARERAAGFGVGTAFGDGDPGHVVGAVAELTGGTLCDVVVEAVGQQAPLDLAGELTREGGRLVVAGFHQDGRRSVDLQLWGWRGIDVVNAHERDRSVVLDGIRRAADGVASGVLDPSPLYTHEVPLAAAGEGFRALAERPPGFAKALVLT